MIEVIKVVNSNHPNRTDKICSSIVARTATWYKEKLNRDDVVFIEKNTIEHKEWIKENNIKGFPMLLFYKDGELKYKRHHIMAQAQIMEVIENL